jgi:prenyltransferase beta subunit
LGLFHFQEGEMDSVRKSVVALVVLLLVASSGGPWSVCAQGPELSERFRSVDKALRWLGSQQNPDGGFGTPSSDLATTCAVVLAFAVAYEEPGSVEQAGNSPLDYLATQASTYSNSAEGAARLILAVVAGDGDPLDFGGVDLVATLDGYRQPSGRYYSIASDGIAAQALALMALQVSKEAVPLAGVNWLRNQQNVDGGWGPMPGQASDTTSTALSVQALVSAGESPTSSVVRQAVGYLQERQTSDAGFAGSAATSVSDPASTAHAVQALLAADESLLGTQWQRCLRTPFDLLLDAQAGDGSFQSDMQVTGAVVAGLMGRALPLPGRGIAALKALDWLSSQQQADGGFGNGGATADAVYAIALCGQNPDGPDWTKGGYSALEALEDKTPDYLAGAPPGGPAGELGKVIRAVEAAGGDPYNFAGMDLVDELKANYNPSTGRYHPFKLFSHNLALMALHAVSETIPAKAVTTIEDEQLTEGGWPWGWDATTPDVDSSGLSMESLVAGGGPTSPDVANGYVAFLESVRFPGGAYPDLASRPEPNCNSTALAIQGLLAAKRHRELPLIIPLDTGGLFSSWDALLSFQEPAGSFAFMASGAESRLLATLEAILALATDAYPPFEPLSEGDATVTGEVQARLTCGDGLQIVAPYTADDDSDGSAAMRYRLQGEIPWSAPIPMNKAGLTYLLLPHLEAPAHYEIEVTYDDPDGVSGQATQYLIVYEGRGCIPLALKAYAG